MIQLKAPKYFFQDGSTLELFFNQSNSKGSLCCYIISQRGRERIDNVVSDLFFNNLTHLNRLKSYEKLFKSHLNPRVVVLQNGVKQVNLHIDLKTFIFRHPTPKIQQQILERKIPAARGLDALIDTGLGKDEYAIDGENISKIGINHLPFSDEQILEKALHLKRLLGGEYDLELDQQLESTELKKREDGSKYLQFNFKSNPTYVEKIKEAVVNLFKFFMNFFSWIFGASDSAKAGNPPLS